MSLLSLEELCTEIDIESGTIRALDHVSFSIAPGETFALLGESGCGKSMTALSMLRLLPPGGRIAAGQVRLDGRDLCALTEAQMRRVRGGEIAMIFQEPGTSLNPVLTVGQQIAEVLSLHRGLGGPPARAAALDLLKQVGIPDPERRLGEYPFQFSGGMKQRVMIAMALAGEPRLLIADEPTTALDVTIQAQVLELMAELQRERAMAMLLITHDLGVVARMAHRIGVMYAGELIEDAPRDRFFAAPAHPYSRKLFDALPEAHRARDRLATIRGSVPPLTTRFRGCRFAERCDFALPHCRDACPAWHQLADGRRVRCHLFEPQSTAPAPAVSASESPATPIPGNETAMLLRVQELQVHFPITAGVFRHVVGHVRAVDGVSIDIRAGRTLALVGESGCGKTTVGKAILRLIEPTAGGVWLGEQNLGELDHGEMRALRARMQMVFQDPFGSLNPRLRVSDIIAEGIAALARERAGPAQREQRIAALLEQVGLRAEMADRYPHEFSGGQRQRIAIARALAVQPDLIICDEPTSALDVSVQAQILNLLQQLQAELGIAYLFITHNISVVEYLAHEVAVMYLGRIVEYGSVEKVLGSPLHPYTQALLAAVPRVKPESGAGAAASPLRGDMPSPSKPPAGCHFHPRCPHATDICRQQYPQMRLIDGDRQVRCHLL